MRDGAMLHIIRYYHPEVVALFLTREMMKRHEKDDRYRKAICAVCPDIRSEDIRIIDHGEIVDANKFELFDRHFRKELEKLHKKYPNHEILVNITSGTPQMEASLYVLAVTLPFPVKLVQVNSPSRFTQEDRFGSVEETLAKLAESELSTPDLNRSVEVHPQNLTKSMQTENIKALLKSYDYQAVYSVLEKFPELFSDQVFNLCRSAGYRMRLETERAYQYAQKGKHPELFALHGQPKELEEIYEYILTLDILLKRGAYGDYARAVSPAITAIMEPMTSRCLGYSIHNLCILNEKGVWRLEPEHIQAKDAALWNHINHSYSTGFHPSPISTDNMLKILNYCAQQGADLDLFDFEELRSFEGNVRNLAAHTIAAISEETIENACGDKPNIYQDKLHRQFRKLYGQRLTWDDYDRMNDRIIEALDRR